MAKLRGIPFVVFLLVILSTFQAGCGKTSAPDPAPVARKNPIRALFILGGEHHPYEGGAKILAEALGEKLDMRIDMVRIDQPPEGFPKAEKATILSNPGILEDPDLRRKYDLILAYNQEAYTKLTPGQRDGYLEFVRSGGSWVGMHSAADFLKDDPEYVSMVGGKFQTHPPFQEIQVRRTAIEHPIVEGIEDFTTPDEFYYLADCPLEGKTILLEGPGPDDGKIRPMAWTKRYGRGKVFYTVLGHAEVSFKNPYFQKLMHQAVVWALEGR